MVQITFEEANGKYPDHTEGPFIWIEQLGANMFGCREEGKEAEEIAGLNADGWTWDAGPIDVIPETTDKSGPVPTIQRKRRKYTRWTISEVK